MACASRGVFVDDGPEIDVLPIWLPIEGLGDYRQEVFVVSVSEQDFDAVVADGTSGVSRVTVRVTCQGDQVLEMSWLVVGSM